LLVNAILLYISRDGTKVSLSGTAVKTVNSLASLLFMDRLRFTPSNSNRTRLYMTYYYNISTMTPPKRMKIFVHYKQKKSLIQSHEISPASIVSFMDLDFGNERCFYRVNFDYF
jgi:hypothetical protein